MRLPRTVEKIRPIEFIYCVHDSFPWNYFLRENLRVINVGEFLQSIISLNRIDFSMNSGLSPWDGAYFPMISRQKNYQEEKNRKCSSLAVKIGRTGCSKKSNHPDHFVSHFN